MCLASRPDACLLFLSDETIWVILLLLLVDKDIQNTFVNGNLSLVQFGLSE